MSSELNWKQAIMLALAAGAAALCYWFWLPPVVIAYNDDFGYYRSVVETVAHMHPWTDDWLEPWNASLATLSAGIWCATDSFKLATYGLQALLAGAAFALIAAFLLRRGWSMARSLIAVAWLITTPTILWKSFEYTGFLLSLVCLIGAILLAETKRWWWFLAVVCLAMANRQSAIAWLGIPFADWFLQVRREQYREAGKLVLVLIAAVVFYGVCAWGMNQTHAQRVMTAGMWRDLELSRFLSGLVLASLVALVAAGLAGFISAMSIGLSPEPVQRGLLRASIAASAVGVLWCISRNMHIGFEHPLYQIPYGALYWKACLLVAVVGWALTPFRCHPQLLTGCLFSAILVSLRTEIWDYYLVDCALMAFLCSLKPVERGVVITDQRTSGQLLAIAMLSLTVLQYGFVHRTKEDLDHQCATAVIFEQQLRTGAIDVTEMTVAPFGLLGWHLFPYFIQHEGGNSAYIGEFRNYVQENCLLIERREWGPDPKEPVLVDRVAPVDFANFHFLLKRGQPAPARWALNKVAYHEQAYPLNDEEWNRLRRTSATQ